MLAALAVAAALVSPGTASEVYKHQQDVINKMARMFPAVEVTTVWAPCGEENSMYFPELKVILLCTEFSQDPDAADFVAAHEMSHAVETQLLGYSSESDADELAGLVLLTLHQPDDVLGAAIFFASQRDQSQHADPHPSNRFRGWELACMEQGWEDDTNERCTALYDGLLVKWATRLALL